MTTTLTLCCAAAVSICLLAPYRLEAVQQDSLVAVHMHNDSVTIRFVDTELRAAVQALGRYLDRPIAFGAIGNGRVTLETPKPVPRSDVPSLLRGLLESHNYRLVDDSILYRVEAGGQAVVGGRRGALDGPIGGDGRVELFVIRLRHASARDVAATVNALYGRAGALGERGSRPPTLTEQLRETRVPPVEAAGGAATQAMVAQSATLTGEVTIVPDPSTNSLLVRASQRDFELIRAAVNELDVRPLQVLIEVLIAEVRSDRRFEFGLELGLDTTRIPERFGVTGSVAAYNAGLGLGDFVLQVMNVNGRKLDATLRAASARGDVAIISRPVLLAANNETAEILVGSQRPFVQVSRSLPTDTPTRDQVVQYKDVGTRLSIHPTISADGYVMLDVTQEINAATAETSFDAPVISTRSVQTRLLVRDSQTVVLGGLIDRQRDRARSGIPVLSSIPVFGGLFGSRSRRTVETELLVFLTPRILRNDDEVDDVTTPLLDKAGRLRP